MSSQKGRQASRRVIPGHLQVRRERVLTLSLPQTRGSAAEGTPPLGKGIATRGPVMCFQRQQQWSYTVVSQPVRVRT